MIAYQRNTGKIGSSGYVSKNVQLMFVDLKTRKPVGPNTCGEIWCQTPSSIVLSDRIKMIESEYDTKRTNEGPLQLSLNDLIIIISKMAYKNQKLCKQLLKKTIQCISLRMVLYRRCGLL